MISASIKEPVTRVVSPLCRWLLKIGVSANLLSALGGLGASVSAIAFFTHGYYFWGMVVTLFFILFDLLDGTLARMSESGGSTWGALLDSTLDRISDAAVLGSVAYYLMKSNDRLVPVFIVALVTGGLVSYIKARAEGLGIECNGGFAERTDRLIIIFVALGFAGLGVPYILAVGAWILALASVYTIFERLAIVYRATSNA
ncbi:MAG TPA: CDP-alcohol phosphatidyltransferase family protein [Candidatus Nanopelagicaceae bacterium]